MQCTNIARLHLKSPKQTNRPRNSVGSEFQTVRPATEKARWRWPNVIQSSFVGAKSVGIASVGIVQCTHAHRSSDINCDINVYGMAVTLFTLTAMQQTDSTHFYKVSVFGVADCHHRVHFFNQFLFLVVIKVHVPLCQPRLASSVLNQNKSNLQRQTRRLTSNTGIRVRARPVHYDAEVTVTASTRSIICGRLRLGFSVNVTLYSAVYSMYGKFHIYRPSRPLRRLLLHTP